MGFLIFGYDVLVFMGQIRDPLRNRLESAIQGTGELAHQNRGCFVDYGELKVLSGQRLML